MFAIEKHGEIQGYQFTPYLSSGSAIVSGFRNNISTVIFLSSYDCWQSLTASCLTVRFERVSLSSERCVYAYRSSPPERKVPV